MTVIGPDDHFALLGLLFGCVSLAFWLERFPWAKRLSATLLVIVIPLALSNFRVIPRQAPTYDFVSQYFVTAAIPLLLFKADLRRVFAETGRTLIAFALGVVGTMVGVLVALLFVPVGDDAAAIAAANTGGYIGGSLNFVAVAQMVGLDDPTRFSAVLAAETAMGLSYLLVLSVLPGTAWFARWAARSTPEPKRSEHVEEAPAASGGASADDASQLQMWAGALALSLLVCAIGLWMARLVGVPDYALLFITALAVLLANAAKGPLARIRGDTELGMLLMFVFFAVFGAGTDLVGLVADAPVLLLFSATIVAIHAATLFGLGRIIGLDPREVAVASNACLLGPPTAAAEAMRNGWDDLVTPGLLCGILGYVIGNFAGVTLFEIVSSLS